MLVELSVMEQRYQAVLAVIRDGVPIVEVADRFDVSRQAVHRWLRWYEDQGLPGLADRSHRHLSFMGATRRFISRGSGGSVPPDSPKAFTGSFADSFAKGTFSGSELGF